MNLRLQNPERVLGPVLAVLLVAGIGSVATYDETEDGTGAAEGPTSTTTTAAPADDTDDTAAADDSTTTTTTRPGGSSTTTSRPGATTTTTPPTTDTTPTTTVAPPPEPADLIVHFLGTGPITVQIENAGPGSAPDVRVELSGFDALDAATITVGDGVACGGQGTVTCTVANSEVGGIIGEFEVPVPDGACLVATVSSSAEEPHPGDNTRQRGSCN